MLEQKACKIPEAMALAEQALVAAELLLDSDFSKSLDQAQTIIVIVNCSDITSKDFDETLLKRLVEPLQ